MTITLSLKYYGRFFVVLKRTTLFPINELMRLDFPTLGWPTVPMVKTLSSVVADNAETSSFELSSIDSPPMAASIL